MAHPVTPEARVQADPLAIPAPAEPFRFVVEEGKVHEFARATRSRCAEHLRPGDPVAPLTFLTASQLWMAPENSAWHGVQRDVRTRLHGEQDYVFYTGALTAGDSFSARQFVDRRYAKQGRRGGTMVFSEWVTRFWRDREDEPVADMRTVSIQVEAAPSTAAVPEQAAPSTAAVPEQAVAAPTDDPDSELPLTITDFVRYQGASGDFNPIHHDPAVARSAGYTQPFAVGMYAAGVAANKVSERVGTAAVRRYRVRWQAQAWPGDSLRYEVSEGDGALTVRVTRPDGSVHLTAWAELAGGR